LYPIRQKPVNVLPTRPSFRLKPHWTTLVSRAIVESSVEMARRLGIKSVAEGVETQSDWDVLKAAGCDMARGYFIAESMEGRSFPTFCAA
jgi:EAL domain-containing protein (putative c-di-GMP-specific phosphodiesterase class I)